MLLASECFSYKNTTCVKIKRLGEGFAFEINIVMFING